LYWINSSRCDTTPVPFQPDQVFRVTWWQVGSHVVAMAEYPEGQEVDIHNAEVLGGGEKFNMGGYLTSEDFPDDANVTYDTNPAHQAWDSELGLISTTGASYFDSEINETVIRRLV
jgi:hypothetical protein